jgi:hypothetical protein
VSRRVIISNTSRRCGSSPESPAEQESYYL